MTDIYVITFNNAMLVEYQIKTLRKFFTAPFNVIIVDNNNWLHSYNSHQVSEICKREDVEYIKAPDSVYQTEAQFDPSMKLGETMNWIFNTHVKGRRAQYFGFLDHDAFLVKEFDIRSHLDNYDMYGRVCFKPETKAWNLHVTANFFRLDRVSHLSLDFRPSHKYMLDTGGANYEILYKDRDRSKYELSSVGHRYAEHDVNRPGSVQHYEIMDNKWFHICASSHDQLVGDGQYKMIYAKGFLDAKLLSL